MLTSSHPSGVEVVFSIPSPQSGTLSPRIESRSVSLAVIGKAGLYTIYSSISEVDKSVVYRSSVDIVAHTEAGAVEEEFRKLAEIIG